MSDEEERNRLLGLCLIGVVMLGWVIYAGITAPHDATMPPEQRHYGWLAQRPAPCPDNTGGIVTVLYCQ